MRACRVCFQVLPAPIIARVLRCLQRIPRSGAHCRRTGLDARSALELLRISRRWRAGLKELLCSEYIIEILGHGQVIQGGFTDWPAGLPQPDQAHLSLVRRLTIDVDYGRIFNGSAVHAMHHEWSSQQAFAGATSLYLSIHHNHGGRDALMHDYDGHAQVFVRHIRSMAPQTRNVYVKYAAYTNVGEMPTDHSLNALLSGMFSGSRYSALAVTYNDFVHVYRPQVSHPLSRIDCCWNEQYALLLPLLHSSAETLLELRIACHGASREKLNRLFINDAEKCIVYGRLQRLAFDNAANGECFVRPSLPRWEVVPRLKHLHLGMPYPFSDDTLFRGNAATLESLWVTPDIPFLYMVEHYGVFVREKYTRLRHITVAPYSHHVSDKTDSSEMAAAANRDAQLAAATAQFVHRVSPLTQVVDVRIGHAGERLMRDMVHSTQMAELRELRIKHTQLLLADIVVTLQALPRLATLHCICGGVGNEYAYMPLGQMASSMRRKYYPLSMAFRFWEITHDYHAPMRDDHIAGDMVACTLLISAMCPLFVQANISSSHRKKYNAAIKQAIARNWGGKFTKNLKRLLLPA